MYAEPSASWEAVSGSRLIYCSASGLWGRVWMETLVIGNRWCR